MTMTDYGGDYVDKDQMDLQCHNTLVFAGQVHECSGVWSVIGRGCEYVC